MSWLSVVIAFIWEWLLQSWENITVYVIEIETVASSPQEFSTKGNEILFTLMIQER